VKRISAIAGTGVFLLLAPGTVAGLVPWWITRWRMQPPLLGFSGFRVIGAVMIAAGIAVVLDSFARFALQGLGTPAPILPTRHLVVSGLYQYVRNPMYVGVLAIILGQGLLLGDGRLFAYGVLLWLGVHFLLLVMKSRRFDAVSGRNTKRSAAMFRGGFRISVRGAAGMEHNLMQMSSPHIKEETL
jgi:protein-S-isoprenylcysteine O-methyltransferase Ste14